MSSLHLLYSSKRGNNAHLERRIGACLHVHTWYAHEILSSACASFIHAAPHENTMYLMYVLTHVYTAVTPPSELRAARSMLPLRKDLGVANCEELNRQLTPRTTYIHHVHSSFQLGERPLGRCQIFVQQPCWYNMYDFAA